MSDEQQSSAGQRGKSNVFRIVLIVVLVVAIAALVFDRRARSACTAAHEQVSVMLEAEESPTQTQVRAALDRQPDRVYQLGDGRIVEQYIWNGTAHEYSLYTYVTPGVGDLDYVTAATLNQVQEGVDLQSATELEDKSIGAGAAPSLPPARREVDDAQADADSATAPQQEDDSADSETVERDASSEDATQGEAATDDEEAAGDDDATEVDEAAGDDAADGDTETDDGNGAATETNETSEEATAASE